MSTPAVFIRQERALVPADDDALEMLARIPIGTKCLVSIVVPRNLRQHRLAWVLATRIAEAMDLEDKEAGMDLLKISARHVRWITNPLTGEIWPRPLSIDFGSLDQIEFDRIFRRMVFAVTHNILPGVRESDLKREIEEMLRDRRWDRR